MANLITKSAFTIMDQKGAEKFYQQRNQTISTNLKKSTNGKNSPEGSTTPESPFSDEGDLNKINEKEINNFCKSLIHKIFTNTHNHEKLNEIISDASNFLKRINENPENNICFLRNLKEYKKIFEGKDQENASKLLENIFIGLKINAPISFKKKYTIEEILTKVNEPIRTNLRQKCNSLFPKRKNLFSIIELVEDLIVLTNEEKKGKNLGQGSFKRVRVGFKISKNKDEIEKIAIQKYIPSNDNSTFENLFNATQMGKFSEFEPNIKIGNHNMFVILGAKKPIIRIQKIGESLSNKKFENQLEKTMYRLKSLHDTIDKIIDLNVIHPDLKPENILIIEDQSIPIDLEDPIRFSGGTYISPDAINYINKRLHNVPENIVLKNALYQLTINFIYCIKNLKLFDSKIIDYYTIKNGLRYSNINQFKLEIEQTIQKTKYEIQTILHTTSESKSELNQNIENQLLNISDKLFRCITDDTIPNLKNFYLDIQKDLKQIIS
tara:strand:- start:143 stop:1624 length:1482 start_codon:yes stop_codon:yes gene_type:complete